MTNAYCIHVKYAGETTKEASTHQKKKKKTDEEESVSISDERHLSSKSSSGGGGGSSKTNQTAVAVLTAGTAQFNTICITYGNFVYVYQRMHTQLLKRSERHKKINKGTKSQKIK